MPTIIDSLIVKLGIDDKDLTSKSGTAGRKLKDLEGSSKSTEATVKQLGTTSKSSASGVESLTKAFGSLLAVLGGAYAIKTFIQDTIQSSAALDRLSKNLNVSAGEITAWSNAAEQLGGTASGLQGSLSLISKAQTDIQLTGESSLIPFLNYLGVSLADVDGKALKSTDVLQQLAGAAEGKDRRTMSNLFATMGFDQGTINLLLQGRKELDITLAHQKDYAEQVNKFAPTAAKMQRGLVEIKQQFNLLGMSLLQQATPALEKVLGAFTAFTNWIKENIEFIKDLGIVLGVIGTGLGVIALLTSPIAGVVVGIGLLATAIAGLWQDYQTWKRGGDSLIDWEKWKPGIDAAKEAIKSLATVVKESFGAIFEDVGAVQKLINGDWRGALKAARKSDDHVRNALTSAVHSGVIGGVTGVAIKAAPGELRAFRQANGQSVTSAYAMQYFLDRGMSAKEAAAYTSQIHSESNGKANAVGDHGAAYGLIQWHKDRQDNFKKLYGHDIKQSTNDEQLGFIVHEVKQGTEQAAGKKVAAAATAEDAGRAASMYYVRPADRAGEASKRGAYAAQLSGIQGASTNVAAAGKTGATSGTANDNRVTNTVGNVTIQTQPGADAQGILKAFQNMNGLLVGNAVRGVS